VSQYRPPTCPAIAAEPRTARLGGDCHSLGAVRHLEFARRSSNTVLLGVLLALLAGCGGHGDGRATFARAQDGLAHLRGGTIELHAVVRTLIPIERTATFPAGAVPLSELDLTHWTKHPHRLGCAKQLECARADVDVDAAALAADRSRLDPLRAGRGCVGEN
jgi:hypothetical protein